MCLCVCVCVFDAIGGGGEGGGGGGRRGGGLSRMSLKPCFPASRFFTPFVMVEVVLQTVDVWFCEFLDFWLCSYD